MLSNKTKQIQFALLQLYKDAHQISNSWRFVKSSSLSTNVCQVLFHLLDCVRTASTTADKEKIESGGGNILIHHSRDTAEKQWAETWVLTLAGVARIFNTRRYLLQQLGGSATHKYEGFSLLKLVHPKCKRIVKEKKRVGKKVMGSIMGSFVWSLHVLPMSVYFLSRFHCFSKSPKLACEINWEL